MVFKAKIIYKNNVSYILGFNNKTKMFKNLNDMIFFKDNPIKEIIIKME